MKSSSRTWRTVTPAEMRLRTSGRFGEPRARSVRSLHRNGCGEPSPNNSKPPRPRRPGARPAGSCGRPRRFWSWERLCGSRQRSQPPAPETERDIAERVSQDLRQAEVHYESAISGLEELIETNDGALPDNLRQTLNDNLDLIEGTIEESRTAIATEPESTVARESLLEAFQRKLSLLQNMVLLINEVRKGEGANALELIDEMQRADEPANPI